MDPGQDNVVAKVHRENRTTSTQKRQALRDLNERKEAVLMRINRQSQRQATIKERLQAKLKMRKEN